MMKFPYEWFFCDEHHIAFYALDSCRVQKRKHMLIMNSFDARRTPASFPPDGTVFQTNLSFSTSFLRVYS